MTPNYFETAAIAKLRQTTLPEGHFYRELDSYGRMVLLIQAPDFPTARAIWKSREKLESAILRLGVAEYWQIKVQECPYTLVERILCNTSTLEKLRASLPNGSALKAASDFAKFSLIRNHLIVHAEHPGVACVLMSQDCLTLLADCAEKLGIQKVSILAFMETSEEWTAIKDASVAELRTWHSKRN